MAASTPPFPLLPSLEELHNHQGALQPLNDETRNRLSEQAVSILGVTEAGWLRE